jgi:hypothetical protein
MALVASHCGRVARLPGLIMQRRAPSAIRARSARLAYSEYAGYPALAHLQLTGWRSVVDTERRHTLHHAVNIVNGIDRSLERPQGNAAERALRHLREKRPDLQKNCLLGVYLQNADRLRKHDLTAYAHPCQVRNLVLYCE